MRHEFHFILNEELYFKISKVSKGVNKNLSATIVVLFEHIIPFVEKNHLMSREKDSRYKIIADLKEERYHIHCYLPEELYRKMKQIHHDLNSYSLGQIIRKMIEYFLMGCFKYGVGEFLRRLNKIKKTWGAKKNIYRKDKKKFIRHMSYKFSKFPYLITTYDNTSRPYTIQLIQ